ncbi:ComEA family DNA-binding protein [Azospirillum rugosum]|uniref:DNA uptake protein ComE-like DNA-binding protein n=1 Tax=Azospirillum rugosum TaxID=416170 RepID=A0ABS4SFE9_9PROT|nr:helix-hairpin-helix domain-containing protein [Azospirillum rugosum]MBP2291140.1 DNA uptake protein ComE-like DNA-binding protein [Azospirillum rugosum]MDQ0524796.1 DNA uptake protein ComE-like DNA-binding protein [Azospirillum rugosum]
MKLTRLCAIAAVGALLAVPALAQSTTTSPSTTNRTAPPTAPTPQAKPVPPATSGSTAPSSTTGTGASTSKSSKVIDINTASKDELMTLPGIGEARSDAIVKNRPYRSKDELVSKKIVPSNVYGEIKDQIAAVGGSKNTAAAGTTKKQ